ncbi:MAG: flagellar biosynthetic protein FliO [Tissierellaceae bacterium]
MDLSNGLTLLKTIVVLIIVIGIANISLRVVNKNMKKHNRIIKTIERVPVGNNSSIGIVQICGDYYLMSFSGSDNRILKELDREKVEDMVKEIESSRQIAIDKGILTNILGMREKN